jgi:hypothetical protein
VDRPSNASKIISRIKTITLKCPTNAPTSSLAVAAGIVVIVGIVLLVVFLPKKAQSQATPPVAQSQATPPDSFFISSITNEAGKSKSPNYLGTYELTSDEDGEYRWSNTADSSFVVTYTGAQIFRLTKPMGDGSAQVAALSVDSTNIPDPQLYTGEWANVDGEARLISFT